MKFLLFFVLAHIAMSAPQRLINNPDSFFYQPSAPYPPGSGGYVPPPGGEPIDISPAYVNPGYPGQYPVGGGNVPVSIEPVFVNPYPGGHPVHVVDNNYNGVHVVDNNPAPVPYVPQPYTYNPYNPLARDAK